MTSTSLSHGTKQHQKVLTLDSINPHIKQVKHAVRGPIVMKARAMKRELDQGVKKPFNEVIYSNIGDAHALGQKPITFLRQVVALCVCPELMNSDNFPQDAIDRARRILSGCGGGSIGAYSASQGIELIRNDVASYIETRDSGIRCDPNNVYLCSGATDGIVTMFKLLMSGEGTDRSGAMIPLPQYPLYSTTLTEFNGRVIRYYLDEDNNWALNISELQRAYDEGTQFGHPRVICVINPGNPTGQVLSRGNVEEIIKFAKRNHLFIMADEVYQDNVYAEGCEFHSFKRVMHDLGPEYSDNIELASFHSLSKGYMGECGYRGGYMEICNMDPKVKEQLNKLVSCRLCPPVTGQAALDILVNPPKAGDPSYERFQEEKNNVLGSLAMKAQLATENLNSIPGMKCNTIQGAMYSFPRISMPQKAIDKAEEKGREADSLYADELLENTGIVVIPGNRFGQKPGTYHIRMTILPPVEKMKTLFKLLHDFHQSFLEKYK